MVARDFVIRYDPEKDTGATILKKIVNSTIVKPIKSNKPRVVFVSGGSGSGKSETTLFFQVILAKLFGWDIKKHIDDINIYTPAQYSEKMQKLLYDKELKKVNVATIHEARMLVNAKDWQSFTSRSVAHVNAMSRSIKRIVFFIVSQYIRDISTDIRYTLNHYWRISREDGKPVKLYWDVMYSDERDLENVKLKKRKLQGYLVLPNGKYQSFKPDYFEIPRCDKELRQIMEEADREAKRGIIEEQLQELFDQMNLKQNDKTEKLSKIAEWYIKSPDRLIQLGKLNQRKNWRIHKGAIDRHSLKKEEVPILEKMVEKMVKEQIPQEAENE